MLVPRKWHRLHGGDTSLRVCFKTVSFYAWTLFGSRWSYWYEINMPFPQRSIEPRRVSRLSARDGDETGRRKLRRPVLFSSLDEVSCHTLTSIIYQLSDLSRHASDIFLGIEVEAGMVFRRSCRIQGRLHILQGEVYKLDPKKVQIRKFALLLTCWLCVCGWFRNVYVTLQPVWVYYTLMNPSLPPCYSGGITEEQQKSPYTYGTFDQLACDMLNKCTYT